jgi:molybdenum cofactor synthesis domain-containing protein
MDRSNAAALVIGSELMLGKTPDTNTIFLIENFLKRGIRLKKWVIIPDDPEVIARELQRLLSDGYGTIVVSGGMGPTHDDITVECISKALGRGTTISELARDRMLTKWMAKNPGIVLPEGTERGLAKMATVVKGFRTIENPIGAVEAQVGEEQGALIAIFPGVPREYKALVESDGFQDLLPSGEGVGIAEITFRGRESQIAKMLEELQALHPEVEIGSYPQGPLEVVLRITGECGAVDRTRKELKRRLSSRT